MNSAKLVLGLAVMAICCATFAHALKCYACSDKKSCKAARKVECTAALANQTRNYLDAYHKKVPNNTSPYLECLREYHKSANGEFRYKGCVYSHVRSCSLEMKDFYVQGKSERECLQCGNKDGCNPAARPHLLAGVPLMALILTVATKLV